MCYKALFAIAAALDWEFEQTYVKTAFLNEGIEEDIFVEQPTGQDDGSGDYTACTRYSTGLNKARGYDIRPPSRAQWHWY